MVHYAGHVRIVRGRTVTTINHPTRGGTPAGGSRAEELEAIGRAEDERGWPRPEESLRAALGERLASGGLDVPRGFE